MAPETRGANVETELDDAVSELGAILKKAQRQRGPGEAGGGREVKRRRTERDRSSEELINSVSAEEIEQLRTFQDEERQYQRAFESNIYVQYAVTVASQIRVKDVYAFVNNTYRNYVKQIGLDWSGFVLGGPREVAEAALRALPCADKVYVESAADDVINRAKNAVDARFESENVRKDLYKAITEMRKRRSALQALKLLSRPSPSSGYYDMINLELRTRTDTLLESCYTINPDWERARLKADQVVRYKRSRLLLATAVANDMLWSRLNTLATPKSRMDRKDIWGMRNQGMRALARISTGEIMANQYSYDANDAAPGALAMYSTYQPPAITMAPSSAPSQNTFGATQGGFPISSRY